MGHAQERNLERIQAHQARAGRVHRHLVRARQHQVPLMHPQAPRPRPLAHQRAVHHGKYARVNLFLDHQQIHQRFVNRCVAVVPLLEQQPAKRILHCAPVIVVNTCVFTVGRWMMLAPISRRGIRMPSG